MEKTGSLSSSERCRNRRLAVSASGEGTALHAILRMYNKALHSAVSFDHERKGVPVQVSR